MEQGEYEREMDQELGLKQGAETESQIAKYKSMRHTDIKRRQRGQGQGALNSFPAASSRCRLIH